MSETITTTPVAKPETLLTAQFVIALCGLGLAAGTIAALFMVKEVTALQGTIAGSIISLAVGNVMQFYFGSSKGSQDKDAKIVTQSAPPPPGSTTTTTTTAAPAPPTPQP